jgi:hypothetical protein
MPVDLHAGRVGWYLAMTPLAPDEQQPDAEQQQPQAAAADKQASSYHSLSPSIARAPEAECYNPVSRIIVDFRP